MSPLQTRPVLPLYRLALSRQSSTSTPSTPSYQPPSTNASASPNPSSPAPSSQPQSTAKPNRHRDVYRVFGRAWLRNFLVAVATYQAIYWSWKKLESIEVKHDTEHEIRDLQQELKDLTLGKKDVGRN